MQIAARRPSSVSARTRPPGLPGLFTAAVLVLLPGMLARAQESEPFRTRNLNPLMAIYGLPAWRSLQSDTELAWTSELANHYRFSRAGPDTIALDAETWRNALSWSTGVGEDWSVGIEIPFFHTYGGVLDDVIDGWHSFFGMPDGGRNYRLEDEVYYELENADGPFVELDHSTSSLGDIQLRAGRRVGPDERLHVTAAFKLPTGEEADLTGSGSPDWSVTLLRPAEGTFAGRPGGYFWGAGVFDLGRAEQIGYGQRGHGYMAVLGGGWRITERLGIKGQVDTHSKLYDSLLREIGRQAIQATIGGWVETDAGAVFEFAVVEDLAVSTSPDVVLHFNVRWIL